MPHLGRCRWSPDRPHAPPSLGRRSQGSQGVRGHSTPCRVSCHSRMRGLPSVPRPGLPPQLFPLATLIFHVHPTSGQSSPAPRSPEKPSRPWNKTRQSITLGFLRPAAYTSPTQKESPRCGWVSGESPPLRIHRKAESLSLTNGSS